MYNNILSYILAQMIGIFKKEKKYRFSNKRIVKTKVH